MYKTKKIILTIFLAILFIIIITNFIAGITLQNKAEEFGYEISGVFPMWQTIMQIIVWGTISVFASMYGYSNNDRWQLRKWPWIVFVVFSVISSFMALFSISRTNLGTIIYNNEKIFSGYVGVMWFNFFLILSILGLSITNLVLTARNKNIGETKIEKTNNSEKIINPNIKSEEQNREFVEFEDGSMGYRIKEDTSENSENQLNQENKK